MKAPIISGNVEAAQEIQPTPFEANSVKDGTRNEKIRALNLIAAQFGYEKEAGKMVKICTAESTLYQDAICYAGWPAGMGLCGFIPGTWNYVLRLMEKDKFPLPEVCNVAFAGFDKEHPIFDGRCNWLMGLYLLRKEGDHHWDSSKEKWGTK